MEKGRKKTPSAIVLIFVFTIIVLIGCVQYIGYINDKFNDDSECNIMSDNDRLSVELDKYVNEKFTELKYFSNDMVQGDDSAVECEAALEKLQGKVTDKDQTEIFGVAGTDGKALLTDGTELDLSAYPFFEKTLKDGECFAESVELDSGETYNVFCVGIFCGEEYQGVVFDFENMENLDRCFDETSFTGEDEWMLVSGSGRVISGSIFGIERENNDTTVASIDSISSSIRRDICNNINNDYTDIITAKHNGETYEIYIKKTEINDLYIIETVNLSREDKGRMLFNAGLVIGTLLLLYMFAIVIIMGIQRKTKKELDTLLYADNITGGKSFEKFKLEVEKLVAASVSSTEEYALIDFDVDGFKYVNEIFGYDEGDKLIKIIWKAVDDEIKSGETFARYRADEFVALMKAGDSKVLLNRIEAINSVIIKEKDNIRNYEIKMSFGIYYIDKTQFKLDHAIDWAVLAKKNIKGRRNAIYSTFDERIRDKALRKSYIESMMEKALEKEEFKVFYQPKYDAVSGELSGAEALVRWNSQVEGMIFPSEFIPVFEENGFVTELDKYMFRHVCLDVKKWLDEGYNVVPVSVNLSQLQLYNTKFIDEYENILKELDVPSKYLQLELTETTMFTKEAKMNEIIDTLHSIGFKILMDDFGTGYSSLNMLKNAKVDILKLDKSFVDDIGQLKGNIMVSTIISLGQSLNMSIVAEGVETQEQYEFLRDIFCNEIQGYYFSKPVSAEEYTSKLTKGAS